MTGYAEPFLQAHCPFCNAKDAALAHRVADQFFSGDRMFFLLRCKACGGTFLDGKVFASVTDFLATAYPASYHGGDGIVARGPIPLLGRHAVDRWISHRRPLKVLDVGCGGGQFLKYMATRGHAITGLEPDQKAADNVAHQLQCQVLAGTVETLDPGQRFDLITLWDVLEHFVNPTFSLQRLRGWLDNNGRILFGVPNFDSWEAKLLGAGWFGLEVPRHTLQCTPPHLQRLMTRAGLELTALRSLRGSSYFAKSFMDQRLFENRNRFRPATLKALQRLIRLLAPGAYLIGMAHPAADV